MKDKIESILRGIVPSGTPVEISVPERAEFGHYSTNVAMRLAKTEGKNPLEIAKQIAETTHERAPAGFFEKVEAAPPGLVNFWVSRNILRDELCSIQKNIKTFGKSSLGKNKKVIVE